MKNVVVTALLILGVGLQALSCLGMVAMRSTFDRLHYVAPAGFGLLAIAIAILIDQSFSLISDKALATAALLLVSGPVLVHVTARTARIRELDDWRIQHEEKVDVVER
jgi:multisubunit Na+/H+ antiporter MnhG subunit